MLTLLSNLFRCTCGKCDINLVHNISECYCCKELEGCAEALESDLVVQDLGEGATVDCITSHPGFAPVCLQKWSLRLASHRYRTSEKKIYRQTGSEDGYKHKHIARALLSDHFSLIDAVYLFDRLLPFGSNSPFKNRKCI